MAEGVAIDASPALTMLAHGVLAFRSIADLAELAKAIGTFLELIWWYKFFEASDEQNVVVPRTVVNISSYWVF